jgi:hypothetical protein
VGSKNWFWKIVEPSGLGGMIKPVFTVIPVRKCGKGTAKPTDFQKSFTRHKYFQIFLKKCLLLREECVYLCPAFEGKQMVR